MAERIIQADDAELCTESFGDPSASPLLLIAGIGSSMLWWEAGFCRLLADRDRYVIRYDHRDTGRSTSYEVGSPGYTADDLDATGRRSRARSPSTPPADRPAVAGEPLPAR